MARTYLQLHDTVSRAGTILRLCQCKLCRPGTPDPRPASWKFQVTIRIFGERGFGVLDDYLVEASRQSTGILYSVTPRDGAALSWKHIGDGWKTKARASIPGLLAPLA